MSLCSFTPIAAASRQQAAISKRRTEMLALRRKRTGTGLAPIANGCIGFPAGQDDVSQMPITSLGPRVLVTARDLIGVPAGATVTLDVDLDNNNNFGGETGYTTGTLSDGYSIKLPDLVAHKKVEVRKEDIERMYGPAKPGEWISGGVLKGPGTMIARLEFTYPHTKH